MTVTPSPNRCYQTSTSTGTGSLNLDGSAPAGAHSFVDGVGDGKFIGYTILDQVGGVEITYGQVTAGSPDTITRAANPIYSTNVVGGAYAKVDFASGPLIVFTAPIFELSVAFKKVQALANGSVPVFDGTDWVARTPKKYTNFVGYSKSLTSTSYKMLGLGSDWTIAPSATGKVRVTITGYVSTNSALGTIFLNATYGTGTAPSSGAGQTGTSMTTKDIKSTASVSGAPWSPFIYVAEVGDLTLNTSYWFDMMAKADAGTTDIEIVSVIIEELAS